MGSKPDDIKLMPIRTAVILTLALLVGIGSGLLTYVQDHALPASILAASGAWAAAIVFFNAVIDRR